MLRTRLTLALALFLALIPSASAAATRCRFEPLYLYTLHVEMEAARPSYEPGDVATIHVTVTRPAEHDPAGQGAPLPRPTSEPAEGVRVGISLLTSNDVFFYAYGPVTNAKGKTIVRPVVPGNAKPGPVAARAVAEKYHTTAACYDLYEVGYAQSPALFRVD